jgi:hypothetical protein
LLNLTEDEVCILDVPKFEISVTRLSSSVASERRGYENDVKGLTKIQRSCVSLRTKEAELMVEFAAEIRLKRHFPSRRDMIGPFARAETYFP